MTDQHADYDLISPANVPAFDYHDPSTVKVSSLEPGDHFKAMFTGRHRVVRSISGMIEAIHVESGQTTFLGPFAPVMKVAQ